MHLAITTKMKEKKKQLIECKLVAGTRARERRSQVRVRVA